MRSYFEHSNLNFKLSSGAQKSNLKTYQWCIMGKDPVRQSYTVYFSRQRWPTFLVSNDEPRHYTMNSKHWCMLRAQI